MNDNSAIRKRMVKYLLPVVVSSVIFNIPKFFEAYYDYTVSEVREKNGFMVYSVGRQTHVSVSLQIFLGRK